MIELSNLKTLLGISSKEELKEQEVIETKIKEQRDKIHRMANIIDMDFFDEGVVSFDIDDDWKELSPSICVIECSLNSKEATVINAKFENNGHIKKHKHNRQEEIFVVSGSVMIKEWYKDGPSINVLTAGEVRIIPAYVPHEVKSNKSKLTVVWRPPYPKIPVNI